MVLGEESGERAKRLALAAKQQPDKKPQGSLGILCAAIRGYHSTMSERLRLISDLPSTEPALGFAEYIQALADAIAGAQPPQFTVGIYGPWGTGKSSLLLGLRERLNSDYPDVIPVLFDAWRYERSEYVVVPVLHAITKEIESRGDDKLVSAMRRALNAVIFSVTFKLGPLQVGGSDAHKGWTEPNMTQLDEAFAKPFSEMRAVSTNLSKRRIAVLVDDLDRCSPAHVVALLEAIRLVMDVPGMIFVLAIDYDVMVGAIQEKYPHASGDRFIEKIVQLPFRVPPLQLSTAGFFEQLIPQWTDLRPSLPDGFEALAKEVAITGLEGNPRQVKRLLNAFMLIDRIATSRKQRLDYALLTQVIGLQLRWPSAYHHLQRAVMAASTQSGDDTATLSPLTLLADEADEDLTRYNRQFFSGDIKAFDLQCIFELTTVVVSEPPDRPRFDPLTEVRLGVWRLHCPDCGEPGHPGQQFCGYCGRATPAHCPDCGSPVQAEQQFCAYCGRALEAKQSFEATYSQGP